MKIRKLQRKAAIVLIIILLLTAGSCSILELFGVQLPAAPDFSITSVQGMFFNSMLLLGNTVNIDASASSDPNADPIAIGWDLSVPGSSTTASLTDTKGYSTSFTPDVAGTYTLNTTLSDGNRSSTNTITLRDSWTALDLGLPFNSVQAPAFVTYDFGGNGFISNSASPASDRFGNPGDALSFTTTASYIVSPADTNNFQIGPPGNANGSMSISMWVNLATGGTKQYLISFDNTQDSGVSATHYEGWALSYSDTFQTILFELDNATPSTAVQYSLITLSPSTWYHLALVYDNTTDEFSLYIDGENQGTKENRRSLDAASYTHPTTTAPPTYLYIGDSGRSAGDTFDGIIDEVAVFNMALDEEFVRMLASDRP